MAFTLAELAEQAGGTVQGDSQRRITGIASLERAESGDITFFSNSRHHRQLAATRAAAVILREGDRAACPVDAVVVADPYLAYARVAALFAPQPSAPPGIHPGAVVAEGARIDPSASVGPLTVIGSGAVLEAGVVVGSGCVIEEGVHLGAGSRLVANVTLYSGTRLGRRCLVHGGAVIGSDGFGFAPDPQGVWVKIPQIGGVRIGDDVEVGANTSIDRGALEDTVIDCGVKLDNQIQVAHNVHIGAHTAVAGCVGIAGSSRIGAHCAIGGGAGILGHLEITDGVTITAMSLVTKSIRQPGVYSSGTPLEPNDRWHKNFARFKQLDEMARRLRALERELQTLKKG